MKYINYFWNFISSKNIDNIFGISGGAVADILSKKPDSINWINVGNELQNGFIASVYGYYTKNVGLLFTTTGPGIATALSAYKNAEAEHQPLIVISTFNPLVKEDFQWWNIKQIGDTIGNLIYIENNDEFTNRMLTAINDLMLDMLAAVARKDYQDRRRRQKEGIAKAKTSGLYKGTENYPKI